MGDYEHKDSFMDMKFIDWHSADIIAALRKKERRSPQNHAAMG